MPELDSVLEYLQRTWDQALKIWNDGGWAMWVLFMIATAIFGMGLHIRRQLRAKGFASVSEKRWRRWIEHPDERKGPVGKLLDLVARQGSIKDTAEAFETLRTTETAPFVLDLKVMRVCVNVAPLVGLLGTVTGMLATFGAIATGSGGDKTMGMIADGISEALITTMTGLVVAIPGLFFQYQLARGFERYKAFLAHLETVCTQETFRRVGEQKRVDLFRAVQRQVAQRGQQRRQQDEHVRHAAAAEIIQTLRRAVS